jgi:hypothetical protein
VVDNSFVVRDDAAVEGNGAPHNTPERVSTMSKLTKIVMALAAVLVVTIGLLTGPASAQDYQGGTVVTAPGQAVVDGANVSGATAADTSAAAAVSASGTLPYTGDDPAPITQIGVALVGAGLLVTLVVRNRSRANA